MSFNLNEKNIIANRPTKTIYRDGSFTIKLFHDEHTASDVLNEALNLAIVSQTMIKSDNTEFFVPKLEEVTKIDGKWAIITEFIDGVTLAQMMEENPGKSDEYFEKLVDIQINIHHHTAKALHHHTDKMHRKISASGLYATNRYELHTRLESLPRHNKLCHGDFTPGNVIFTPNGDIYVIDWAHATQGNASADAARTYLRFMIANNKEEGEKYLKLYCEKSDTAKQYVQKWLPIVAASQLVKGKPEEKELLESWANVVEYE